MDVPPWLKKAVLLGNAEVWPNGRWHADTEDGILEMRATLTRGGGKSFQVDSGEYVEVCEDDWHNDGRKDINWDESVESSFLFLPVHEACLCIAKRVMWTRSRHLDVNAYNGFLKVTSMSQLWKILRARFETTKRSTLFWYSPYVFGPHNYYIKGSIDLYDWEKNSVEEKEVRPS